jgi:hypothetical protein
VKGVLDGTFVGKTQKQKLMDFCGLSKPGAALEKPQISLAQTFEFLLICHGRVDEHENRLLENPNRFFCLLHSQIWIYLMTDIHLNPHQLLKCDNP